MEMDAVFSLQMKNRGKKKHPAHPPKSRMRFQKEVNSREGKEYTSSVALLSLIRRYRKLPVSAGILTTLLSFMI